MLFYLLLFFTFAIFGFKIYDKKWRSNYILRYYFGLKGSGKTSLMAKDMFFFKSKGWIVYTDIEGCTIPGVRQINLKDLAKYNPVQHSAIFLDEVGLSMNNREFKSFDAGLREFYALHRHLKCVVTVASQSFDADAFVRRRCDGFWFIQKIAGCLSLARPVVQKAKPNDMSSPASDSPVLTYYKWGSLSSWRLTFLPRYARLFDSFCAPDREELPYEMIPGDEWSDKKAAKAWLRHLNRQARKSG